MTDELKFIISETNNTLALEHNLISFESMKEGDLLQILIDVLAHFNAITKIDANTNDRNNSTTQILEVLQKIQYHRNTEISDPVVLRRSINAGDKKVIYSILRYIFERKENILNLVSSAREDSQNESKGTNEHGQLIEELKTGIHARRDRVQPVAQQIRPLRQEIDELQVELGIKKNANMNMEQTLIAQVKAIQHEIEETQQSINKLHNERQRVELDCERIQNLVEGLREESNNKHEGELSVKAAKQIHEQEQLLRDLKAEHQELMKNEPYRMQQKKMWLELEQLFAVKVKCVKQARAMGIGGTISIAKDSETFTLHNSE